MQVKILICLVIGFHICKYFCDAGQVLFSDMLRPALTNKALFSHFLSASLGCICYHLAYIANNTDADQTASLVNISFHDKNT